MEQHPVPQNVTTFQFRLVGDMTIKQFGYLSGGIILGYVFYKLPLPFFFTWPLAIGSAVLGFGLAFVPVEERPMDIWIASFFKNVYSPTQYVWQKKSPDPTKIIRVVSQKISDQTEHPAAQTATTTTHTQLLKQLVGLFTSLFVSTNAHPVTRPATRAVPVIVPPQRQAPITPIEPAQTTAPMAVISLGHVNDPLAWLKKLFSASPKTGLSPGLSFNNALAGDKHPGTHAVPPPQQHPLSLPLPAVHPSPPVGAPNPTLQRPAVAGHQMVQLQGQLSESLAQREQLEKELIALRQQVERQAHASPESPIARRASVMPAINTPTSVRVFTPEAATRAGIPKLTTFPNIVTGIIKDHNGNLLPGMLITVRDGNDMPLRALKTNKLGQFAASTPLPNGTYLVEIEDPKNMLVFDKVQIPLNGAVASPIEVVAKSQKRVERDRLAKEIFGQNQI